MQPSLLLGFALHHVFRMLREGFKYIADDTVGEFAEFSEENGFGLGFEVAAVRFVAADFVRGAGTVILAMTVILWALLSFPEPPAPPSPGDAPAVVQNDVP